MNKIFTCVNALLYDHKKTVTVNEIECAVQIIFGNELSKYAIIAGRNAVENFKSTKSENRNYKETHSNQSKLQLSVSKIRSILRNSINVNRCSDAASIYLTAVVEYICTELIQLSGFNAQTDKKSRITPFNVQMSILQDKELSKLIPPLLGTGQLLNEINNTSSTPITTEENNDIPTFATNTAIKRLCRRAGIEFTASDVYDEIRNQTINLLKTLLNNAKILSEYYGKNTIMYGDIVHEVVLKNIDMQDFIPLEKYNNVGKITTIRNNSLLHQNNTKYKSRIHTQKIKNIVREQNNTNLVYTRAPFERSIRKILANLDTQTKFRISEDAINIIHSISEEFALKQLIKAKRLANHCGAKTVYAKDLRKINQL